MTLPSEAPAHPPTPIINVPSLSKQSVEKVQSTLQLEEGHLLARGHILRISGRRVSPPGWREATTGNT